MRYFSGKAAYSISAYFLGEGSEVRLCAPDGSGELSQCWAAWSNWNCSGHVHPPAWRRLVDTGPGVGGLVVVLVLDEVVVFWCRCGLA